MPDSERILIVDDDARLCRTLERYLAQEGYQVRSATSAREMRRHLAVEGADLVILDLVLPDGVDADKAHASYKDGLLEVTMPIVEKETGGRKITVEGLESGKKSKEIH